MHTYLVYDAHTPYYEGGPELLYVIVGEVGKDKEVAEALSNFRAECKKLASDKEALMGRLVNEWYTNNPQPPAVDIPERPIWPERQVDEHILRGGREILKVRKKMVREMQRNGAPKKVVEKFLEREPHIQAAVERQQKYQREVNDYLRWSALHDRGAHDWRVKALQWAKPIADAQYPPIEAAKFLPQGFSVVETTSIYLD